LLLHGLDCASVSPLGIWLSLARIVHLSIYCVYQTLFLGLCISFSLDCINIRGSLFWIPISMHIRGLKSKVEPNRQIVSDRVLRATFQFDDGSPQWRSRRSTRRISTHPCRHLLTVRGPVQAKELARIGRRVRKGATSGCNVARDRRGSLGLAVYRGIRSSHCVALRSYRMTVPLVGR